MDTLAVAVVLGLLFGAALWFADRCLARAARAWQAAWDRVIAERKVSREQLASAHRLLVEMARSTQPLARAEEAEHLLALRREAATMLNRVQVLLGVHAEPDPDPGADTNVISGEGLRS